jgi:hypothetical protein
MYAARWFVVFMPLMLFWAGAWLRKQHRPMSWALAGLLLIFSLAVAVLGMTDPLPRQGYDGYTPAQALGQLLDGEQRIPADEPARPLLARINRGNPLP